MIEWSAFLGVGLATAAAVAFVLQYLCVHLGTTEGSVSDVLFVSLVCNVVVIVPLGLVVTQMRLTAVSVASFVIAGVVGSLAARVLEFKSVQAIGASRTSPVVAANVFFATVLVVVFLDETVTSRHLAGIVLVVAGVVVPPGRPRPPTSRSSRCGTPAPHSRYRCSLPFSSRSNRSSSTSATTKGRRPSRVSQSRP